MPLLPDAIAADTRKLREALHRHPERSHEEHATCARLEAAVRAFGLEPVRCAETGLYVDLPGDGPLVAVRGDIDALPVREESGVAYASEVDGVMHACGHDVHAAAAYGALRLLLDDPPAGRVRVLFQPGEERGTGAARMVAEGALDGVLAVLGGHVDLDYPVGTVAVQAGAICASTDHFRLTVRGRGGHAARPHQGRDALLIAAQVVVALQQIVAREVEPGTPAVITVGRMTAGERYNILAGRAVLEGTIRAQAPEVRRRLRDAVERVARGTGAAGGAEVEVELFPGNAAVVNDAELVPVVAAAIRELLGDDAVVPLARPNMGGEDFSELLRGRPGVYVRWGADGPGAASAPAHSAGFRVDEGVLPVAAAGLAAAARALLGHLR